MSESAPSPMTDPASNSAPAARRVSRWFWLAIAGMVVIWAVLMLNRTALLARWWAYQLAHSTDPQVQSACLLRLAGLRDRAVPAVQGLLNNPDPGVRELAVGVLQAAGSPRAETLLIGLLDDPDESVSVAAVVALQLPDSESATGALIERLGLRR